MFTLRPYQQKAVNKCLAFMLEPPPTNKKKKKGHGVAVLPTGAGKSLIVANIAPYLDAPVTVFQPSKELLQQNYEKFLSYGVKPAIYSASFAKKEVGQITLATIGSAFRKPEHFADSKYLIVDECHLVNAQGGMYRQFFDAFPNATFLGLSATPYRLVTDGYGGSILKFITRTRPKVFTQVVYYVQNRELFDQGFLAPLQYFPVPGFDRNKVEKNSTGADYADGSVQRHFREIRFQDRVVKVVQRAIERGRKGILVFTRFVEESRYVANNVPGTAVVTAETPAKVRAQVLAEFRSGTIKAVCNVGVLTTGFDYPELDTVILARPTRSLQLYYQMVGRCMRPHPDKDFGMVVDMVELVKEFGKVEDIHLDENGGKWIVRSGARQLTNIYYGDRDQQENAHGVD